MERAENSQIHISLLELMSMEKEHMVNSSGGLKPTLNKSIAFMVNSTKTNSSPMKEYFSNQLVNTQETFQKVKNMALECTNTSAS